jgi:hypothetical protein
MGVAGAAGTASLDGSRQVSAFSVGFGTDGEGAVSVGKLTRGAGSTRAAPAAAFGAFFGTARATLGATGGAGGLAFTAGGADTLGGGLLAAVASVGALGNGVDGSAFSTGAGINTARS